MTHISLEYRHHKSQSTEQGINRNTKQGCCLVHGARLRQALGVWEWILKCSL